MNYLKSFVIIYFLSLNFNTFSKNTSEFLSDKCHNNFVNKEWIKAQINCESELANDKSPHKSLVQLSNLAHIFTQLENQKRELFYLDLIKAHPEFSSDLKQQYRWHRSMGLMAFYKTNYNETLGYFRQTLDIAVQMNDKELQSKSYNDLGILYSITGDYSLALENYQKSLELKLEFNDDYAAANTYSNIGSLLLELEKPVDSIDYLLHAIKYYKLVNNTQSNKMVTHVHEELSMAYLKSDQSDEAKFYINKILASSKVRTTNEEQSNASLVLAKYYNEEGKPEIAQMLLSLAIYDDKPMYFLETSLELAKIELKLKNTEKAKNVALKGLNIAKKKNDIFYQFNFNRVLSQTLEHESPKMALNYLKDYQSTREDFLKKKYDSKIDTIEYQIKKHKFDKDMLAEQLANSEKQKRISDLTNWVLLVFLFLLMTFMAWALYIYKKRKEKNQLLVQIKYHKDQLELLNAIRQERDEDHKVTSTLTKQHFKEALTKAMVEAVDIWNRHAGKNRIDLAEKSKVWTVTIDNGTLRTRSMDKYLSLKNIPANPRWRKVVRTCHFILSDSRLNSSDRDLLNNNLNQIMQVIKAL